MNSLEDEMNADRAAIEGDLNRILNNSDNAHEVGGGGDAAMGSERAHFKRKKAADDDESLQPLFRPRTLFDKLTGLGSRNSNVGIESAN